MVDWLQIGQSSGHGDTQILIKAVSNPGDARTTSLSVIGDNKSIEIPVYQTISDGFLRFDIISGGTIHYRRGIREVENAYNGQIVTYIAPNAPLKYQINNDGVWHTLQCVTSGTSFNVSAGDVVCFKGDNKAYAERYFAVNCGFSDSTATFNISGNLYSLICNDGGDVGRLTSDNEYAFVSLFSNCKIVNAGNLILPTNTVNHCYANMFGSCTGLTTAPELPSNTVESGCYSSMFENCTSLTTAPELHATTLAGYCYYQMFAHCTSLTIAPELPASTLVTECYKELFYGCTNLNYIKCLATDISAFDSITNWVGNVSQTGTFVKDASMTSWTTGVDGIPTGWSVIDAT